MDLKDPEQALTEQYLAFQSYETFQIKFQFLPQRRHIFFFFFFTHHNVSIIPASVQTRINIARFQLTNVKKNDKHFLIDINLIKQLENNIQK